MANLDERVKSLEALLHANDRRYTEVAQEREKALKIKEEADKAALGLAREIQTYKDEKANELRSQIERERGTYATQQDIQGVLEKLEAQISPLSKFVQSETGRRGGINLSAGVVVALVTAIPVVVVLANVLTK